MNSLKIMNNCINYYRTFNLMEKEHLGGDLNQINFVVFSFSIKEICSMRLRLHPSDP
jgi:hypothetical protein